MIRLKRAYDKPSPQDGVRFLVDALWPRGLTKAGLKIHSWLKEAAPSRDLRQWFGHDPQKWGEFRKRYFAELDKHPESWAGLREAAGKGTVTLVYGARDTEHNNAVALADYLRSRT